MLPRVFSLNEIEIMTFIVVFSIDFGEVEAVVNIRDGSTDSVVSVYRYSRNTSVD